MFRYLILRTEQKVFCGLYGCALALVQMLLFAPVSLVCGLSLTALSVASFWAGLGLYTRHTDQRRKAEVSPKVRIRDGIQTVAELPRHEKARIEWQILQDDEVFLQQRGELISLTLRIVSRGMLYMPTVMLAGLCFLAWGFPQDAVRLVTALRKMPATDLVHQTGFVLRYVLLISVMSALIADVMAGRGLMNAFRRALFDRLPAEAWRIRRGTER